MKINTLTDYQLNEQLAPLTKWTIAKKPGAMGDLPYYLDPHGEWHSLPPNYTGNLNEIQEAVQIITPTEDERECCKGLYIEYLETLCRIVDYPEDERIKFAWTVVNASPRQRAEALLEVLSNKELA